MLEIDFHPVGAVAFAEARGQRVPARVEVVQTNDTMEIEKKKSEVSEEELNKTYG